MTNKEIWVSFCIPTNGVLEWVRPVLESILEQKVPRDCYEVVVTDNGDNEDFAEVMADYIEKFPNVVYQKTNAVGFLNQIEAFRLAKGRLIKFVNHRMLLLPNTIAQFIAFSKKEWQHRPQIYFSNGMLNKKQIIELETYDSFMEELSVYSSWSAGIAIWREDLEQILMERAVFDDLFPHISFLLPRKDTQRYVIHDVQLLREQESDDTKKGKYNLFFAFAVRYPEILANLLSHGDIKVDTFALLKRKLRQFLGDLYVLYILQKRPCSYQLDDYKKYLNVFFRKREIVGSAWSSLIKSLIKSLVRRLFK